MLSVEQNERLTRVGPGTPMGELLRRYWMPVATQQELRDNPVKAVRILGEALTVYRDRQGRLGLVAERCAHRGVNLRHGIPENEGLRCPYHGWMYDASGQCIDQPAESPESTFKNKVKIASYPVEELGGLIWGYLGPSPTPLLPRWDVFVDEAYRSIGSTVLPCNWLQAQENAVDTVHTEYLHGHFGLYAMERLGSDDPVLLERFRRFKENRHAKIRFEPRAYGIQKFRLRVGASEDNASWTEGHPLVFPNYVLIGNPGSKELQMRVPIDDTTTWHVSYNIFFAGPGVDMPSQDPIPSFEVPIRQYPDWVLGHDVMIWPSQGEIADRSDERLGESDIGLIMFRRMLEEQVKVVEDGGEPMNVFRPDGRPSGRDPEANQRIDLPMENYGPLLNHRRGYARHLNIGPLNPAADELDDYLAQTADAWKRSGAKAPAHASR